MTKDEVLRMALEALKQIDEVMPFPVAKLAQKAIREVLAQPEQKGCMRCNTPKKCALYGCSPLTWPAEQPTQPERPAVQGEPVVWMYQDKSTHEVRFQKHMRGFVDHGATYETPLYTTPQPAVPERKPLTEEEIQKLLSQHRFAVFALVRAVEAAHGITGENK